jgi:glycosyltransferase involved in cell wall biosynthesis
VSEKDTGQSNAINKGFHLASGEILAWLNSDDYYEENIFGDIVQYFAANPDCMFLYGDITFVDRKRCPMSKITGDTINYRSLIKCPDIVRQPSCFWRRGVMQELGDIDENLHLVMDYDFFLRGAKKYPFHYMNKNLSYYRYYDENKSLSMMRQQISEIRKVYKKNEISLNFTTSIYLIKKYFRSLGLRKIMVNIITRFTERSTVHE